MDKTNLLRHTDLYDLIRQDGQIILIDLRTTERRYLEPKETFTIDNLSTVEFEDWALNTFEV